jgi:cation diffusion facilitator CzcD-associated flavoprotein CzcO|tara:strand:- start:88515 stop:90038 length:1524 start_codon:yes stop_codon:yes gene_type:complete
MTADEAESGWAEAELAESDVPRRVDVLIVGAGLSGIGAAVHLGMRCPRKSYAIVEAGGAIGGTWDLFRYPGIRSDSDMHTLGYMFKPWTEAKSIADGPAILKYIRETADEYDVRRRIHFHTEVVHADWSSESAEWIVTVRRRGKTAEIRCGFLYMNSGYYDYSQGYRPEFAGEDRFAGRIVHPQHWPEDLDHAGKRVAVIGSGATAVTLVPALAKKAAHVTMVQRSPSWIMSRPAEDRAANFLRRWLGAKLAYRLTRIKNVWGQRFLFRRARAEPEKIGAKLLDAARRKLGAGFDVETHLTPRYGPWEQRLCLVPDDDLFDALKAGNADMVTGEIATFTPDGLKMKDGTKVEADIVVTATGLNLKLLGGMTLSIDGEPARLNQTYPYKGVMFAGIPNLASTFGYSNASWTLKADIAAIYVCRLLNEMDRRGADIALPELPPAGEFEEAPLWDLSSGYFQRAAHIMPKGTNLPPWHQPHDYVEDRKELTKNPVDDGTMIFRAAGGGTI